MGQVVRMLRAFDRDDDELVGEWPIDGLDLADLQRLFGVDDEMYDSYRVEPEHAAVLGRATGLSLDLSRYEYFVDADGLFDGIA